MKLTERIKAMLRRTLGAAPMRSADMRAAGFSPETASALTLQDLATIFRENGAARGAVPSPAERVSWVYSAINAIARTLASLPIEVVRESDGESIVSTGPAIDLMITPAPGMTTEDLIEEIAMALVESGEAHLVARRMGLRGRIYALDVYNARHVRLDRSDGTLRWYLTDADRRIYNAALGDDHWYIRLPNPYDRDRGLSPLQAAALGVEQDYSAATYNSAMLRNGAAPGGLYTATGDISEEERAAFMAQIKARHGGPVNANRPLVIGGGMEYKPTAMTNVDLALIEARKMNREEIFAAFGVPPVLGGVFDSAHYNVADSSIEIFLLNTVMPIAGKIAGILGTLVLPQVQRGVRLRIRVDSHPVWQRIQRAKIGQLQAAISAGVPYNEAIDFLGLPFTAQTWGDTSLLAAGLQTAEQVLEGPASLPLFERPMNSEERMSNGEGDDEEPGDAETEAPTGEEEGGLEARGTKNRLEAYTTNSLFALRHSEFAASIAAERRIEEAQIAARIPAIRRAWRNWYAQLAVKLRARLKRELSPRRNPLDQLSSLLSAPQRAADEPLPRVDLQAVAQRVAVVITEQIPRLASMVEAYWREAVEKSLRDELTRLGVDPARITQLLKSTRGSALIGRILATKRVQVTRMAVRDTQRLRKTLVEGLEKSETVQQLANRITPLTSGDRQRALRIARTEAGQAVSASRFVSAVAAGAARKGWLHGANPRPTHVSAQERYHPTKGSIPVGEPFLVGLSLLMYPRDPNGVAGEIINCNCTMVTVRGEGAAAKLVNIIGASAWLSNAA